MCGRPSGARVSRSHRCSSQSTGNERPRARDNRRENRDDLPPRHEHLLLKRTLLSVAVKHEPRVLRHRPPNDLKDALISVKALEEAYVAAANRVSEAMTGNLRREMLGLIKLGQMLSTREDLLPPSWTTELAL